LGRFREEVGDAQKKKHRKDGKKTGLWHNKEIVGEKGKKSFLT